MPEMRADLTNASLGGKTRFSTSKDSTAVDDVFIETSLPQVISNPFSTLNSGTYKPLTLGLRGRPACAKVWHAQGVLQPFPNQFAPLLAAMLQEYRAGLAVKLENNLCRLV
jgi:hypothetical protein